MISGEKFGKNEHLLKSGDFAKVYKKGRFYKKDSTVLYCLPNRLDHGRLGFSISSRTVKLAHFRNRIRRLFREVYRKRKKYLKEGLDIIIAVKREPVKTLSYQDADTMFLQLAKGLNILI